MSVRGIRPYKTPDSFPRVSGDEPILGLPKLREKWFSPRERG